MSKTAENGVRPESFRFPRNVVATGQAVFGQAGIESLRTLAKRSGYDRSEELWDAAGEFAALRERTRKRARRK
jgi:hypothetical protein